MTEQLAAPENCHAVRSKGHFDGVSTAARFNGNLISWIEQVLELDPFRVEVCVHYNVIRARLGVEIERD